MTSFMLPNRDLPLVSVIIPTRDRASVFYQALESVGEQTYPHIEVIVIDDYSSESLNHVTQDFRSKFPNIRIITHRNPSPKGGGFSRKHGTEKASGELVCFLDDDDLYLPDKIATLERYLHEHPDVDAVFGRVVVRNKDGEDKLLDYSKYEQPLTKTEDIVRLQTNGSLVRKNSLKKANFNPDLKKFQDTQFHLELCRKCAVHLIENPVAIWHKNYSKNQVSHISPSNSKTVLEQFNELHNYLLSTNSINTQDKKFLKNQKIKYIAKLADFRDFLHASQAESIIHRALSLIYRAYYFSRSLYRR